MSDAPKQRKIWFTPNVVDVLAERAVVPRGRVNVCAKCGGKLIERACVACAARASLGEKLARKRELMGTRA